MQVIGLCRFSYPGLGGFQIEHGSLEERIAYLYAPERLEERFRTFECFTLPSIRAQTDPDFIFLIVIGDSLPQEYRRRLSALVADMPQAVIEAYPPGRHREVMKAAMNAQRTRGTGPCLQFRLDDDDAVGLGFVAGLRTAGRQLAGFLNDYKQVAIDFPDGYAARPGPDGIAAAPIHEPLWTPGLGMLTRPGATTTIMNFAHNKLARQIPVFSLPGDMRLRGFNAFNDSMPQRAGRLDLAPLDPAGEARFRTLYNIDADHVRRVFRPSR